MGHSGVLGGPLRQIFQAAGILSEFSYASCLERRKDCTFTMLELAGQIYQQCIPINLSSIIPRGSLLTDTPTYSWSHLNSYWRESRAVREWRVDNSSQPHMLTLLGVFGNTLAMRFWVLVYWKATIWNPHGVA
jgi:acyl transferase domain-containing protein